MLNRLLRVCLLFFVFFTSATAIAKVAQAYALVQVKSGESLSVIASRYSILSEEIMAFNKLDSEMVYVGNILKVPYLKATERVTAQVAKPPPGFRTHRVRRGETLSEVSALYGISIEAIVGANTQLDSIDSVPDGLKLLIPPSPGLVVQVDDLNDVVNAIKDFRVDSIKVAKANKIETPADIQEHSLLFLPGVRPLQALARLERKRRQETLVRVKQQEAEALARAMEQRYTWPVTGKGRISEFYGRRAEYIKGASMQHNGIDIAAPVGTPIVAARAGRITSAKFDRVYGNVVKIKHYGGDITWYAHANELFVEVGDKVERGDLIASIGATGLTTGPHLHFEIRSYGRALNPMDFLESN